MMGDFGLLAVGLVVLTVGAELLVRGSAGMATRLGVPPVVVGLTVVAFGTSSPELAASVQAALGGQPDLAVGNVVGSNIFNVLVILGLSAVVAPLLVQRRLLRLDVPLMVAASLVVLPLAMDGRIGRLEGVLLVASVAVYTTWLVLGSRREPAAVEAEFSAAVPAPGSGMSRAGALTVNGLQAIAGLAGLVLGARWLVAGAVGIARGFGVSDLVIGLTLVAGGTSLPELATSVVAALRGQRDIAVGNVVGSNLFNLLAVLGTAAAISPAGLTVPRQVMGGDLLVMVAAALACLPVFFTGGVISRWEGGALLAGFVAYVGWLVLEATGRVLPLALSRTLAWIVLPTVVVVLAVSVWRELRSRRD